MIFDPHFWLFDSVLSDGLCDLIIERGNEMNKELGVAGGEVVLDMRKSHIAWFDHNDWIAGLCYHYATLANKQAWNFVSSLNMEWMSFMRRTWTRINCVMICVR